MMKDVTNYGLCQGIVKGAIYRPRDTVAKVNVQIRSNRRHPITKKYEKSLLNFTALGDEVKKVADLSDGDVVLIEYHLEERMYINRQTGVADFRDDFIIDDVTVRGKSAEETIPYINKGFLQGVFLGIDRVPGSIGIYTVDMFHIDPLTKHRKNHRLYAFGAFAERLTHFFSKGMPVAVEYKLEKSRHVRKDGETVYFTNCVVVELS